MLKKLITLVTTLLVGGLNATAQAPMHYGPIPTKNQLNWHKMEYYGLVCFGLNTYTGQEWGYGDKSPALFNPPNLDTDQWAQVAKNAGLKGLILVAKHHDGFCLWPSKTTKYTVAASPWKNGKGDVLADLSKSCKKHGLKLGVYVSPWDRNHAEYGHEQYVKDYHEQWREVLTNYGDIFEVWFDGANGGTGYYGGANERRSIPKNYYRYNDVFKLIKSKQPKAIFFGGVNRDAARWVGNEEGIAGKTNWSTFSDTHTTNRKLRMTGEMDGKFWLPAEADTTILHPKKWYYNKNSHPRTLPNFLDIYYNTVGRNATLNLGLSIGPDGLIPQRDVKAMYAVKKQLDQTFEKNIASGSTITASNSRGSRYQPNNVIKSAGNFWATEDGVTSASLQLSFTKKQFFNRLLLQEEITLGQRVNSFTMEVKKAGIWHTIAKETTIGYKRILRFPLVESDQIRITFKTDAPCLTISNLGVYYAPPILKEPTIIANSSGKVSILSNADLDCYYRFNGGAWKKYTKPILMESGGIIEAYGETPMTAIKTATVKKVIGLAKTNWEIISCSFPNEGNGSVASFIDGNTKTMWHTHGKKGRVAGPHFAIIDLGSLQKINGFTLMPRNDGCSIGLVDKYSFYTSTDNKSWELASKGEFSNVKNNPIEQVVKLPNSKKTRFVKFIAEHAVDDNSCIAISEFGLLNTPPPDLDFMSLQQPIPIHAKLEHKEWFTWGASVLKGADNKYHMIYSRWPKKYPFTLGWVVDAEICYAVASKATGPFKHVRTILRGRKHTGQPQAWDGASVYNPHLKKFGDKVYLYYTAGYDPYSSAMVGSRNHVVSHQTIGVLVAESLEELTKGKFERMDTPLLKPIKRFGRFVKKQEEFGDINNPIPANTVVVNPSVTQRPDGKFLMMYKSWKPKGGMTHAVAVSDSPTGPFKYYPSEAFKGHAEDPFIWFDKKRQKLFALVKDFNGNITKIGKSIALFESIDGIEWQKSHHTLASDLNIKWETGTSNEVFFLERPQLLFDDNGEPKVLYAACSIKSPLGKNGHSFNIHIPLKENTK